MANQLLADSPGPFPIPRGHSSFLVPSFADHSSTPNPTTKSSPKKSHFQCLQQLIQRKEAKFHCPDLLAIFSVE